MDSEEITKLDDKQDYHENGRDDGNWKGKKMVIICQSLAI